mmetsp:Transcript_5903/g.15831  ORF Transcript_5903/g.15831 Transcript_5903/m.15831 type:complete len:346 (+) Transcript_5903:171-1208(+)
MSPARPCSWRRVSSACRPAGVCWVACRFSAFTTSFRTFFGILSANAFAFWQMPFSMLWVIMDITLAASAIRPFCLSRSSVASSLKLFSYSFSKELPRRECFLRATNDRESLLRRLCCAFRSASSSSRNLFLWSLSRIHMLEEFRFWVVVRFFMLLSMREMRPMLDFLLPERVPSSSTANSGRSSTSRTSASWPALLRWWSYTMLGLFPWADGATFPPLICFARLYMVGLTDSAQSFGLQANDPFVRTPSTALAYTSELISMSSLAAVSTLPQATTTASNMFAYRRRHVCNNLAMLSRGWGSAWSVSPCAAITKNGLPLATSPPLPNPAAAARALADKPMVCNRST